MADQEPSAKLSEETASMSPADSSSTPAVVAPVTTPDVPVVAPVPTPEVSVVAPVSTPEVSVVAPVPTPEVSVVAPVSTPDVPVVAPVPTPEVSVVAPVSTPEVSVVAPVPSPEVSVVATQAPVSSPEVPVVATQAPVSTGDVPVTSPTSPVEGHALETPASGEKASLALEKSELPEDFNYKTSLLPETTNADAVFDEEENVQKLKYPKSVFFIIVNEFCERFSFYGLRTLLAIYMVNILHYSDDTSTVIYHGFVMLCYFFPVFGAIIADSLLGKFRTIVYLSIVFAIGNITLTLASMDEAIGIPAREISMLGLFLIAIGTGGIKPCVAAFGGDQFIVPQQQLQLERFFSIYYFTINSGSFVSTFITPILREDVHCMGTDSCYPLAFGVPAILMITSIVVFLAGKRFYIMKKPSGNIIMEIFRVIWHALCRKRKSTEKKDHWLEYAEEKYGRKSVHDIKLLLKVLFLYLPLPIFWALYDQQGSRWTFQATRMNGAIGSVSIKAEQLQVVNPLLILAFVPLFDFVLYPLFAKCHFLTKPLHRLGAGGILAGVAFLLSAFVELTLEPTYAVVPKDGNGQMRFYNSLNCPIVLTTDLTGSDQDHIIEALGIWEIKGIPVKGSVTMTLTITANDTTCGVYSLYSNPVRVDERKARSILITTSGSNLAVKENMEPDDVDKTSNAEPKIRIIYNFLDTSTNRTLILTGSGRAYEIGLASHEVGTAYKAVPIAQYEATINGIDVLDKPINLEIGGVYSLLVSETTPGAYKSHLNTITNPNSVHMLWLMPQYIVMTAGEVMYSVTGVQFSFTQAPVSMKAVIQAAWLITIAVGNLIVVIIAESKIFDRQIFEFLLFAGLMFLDMMIFGVMAWNYKYIDLKEEEEMNQIAMVPKKSQQENGNENKAFSDDHEK